MPASNRTFNYTLIPTKAEDLERVTRHATRWLNQACEGDKKITCHGITGDALGVVTMSMTIRARDRWWAAQLAQDVLNYVLWSLEHSSAGLERGAVRLALESERQAPHDHRGYAHGRTKRYRERRRPGQDSDGRGAPDSSSAGSETVTGTSSDTSAASTDAS